MINPQQANALAQAWIAAWNSHDLERILAHYVDDFEMISPLIVKLMGEPSGRLRGKPLIREYWRRGLAASPDLHFDLEEILLGASSVTLLYRNQAGKRVAEVLTLDDRNQVIAGSAHYPP